MNQEELLDIITDLRTCISSLDSRIKALEARSKRWKPPTLEDVRNYCNERNKGVDPELWYNHYTSNGWKVGKVKMADWKAAVGTWEKSEFNKKDLTLFAPNSAPKNSIPVDYGMPSKTAINRTEFLQSK